MISLKQRVGNIRELVLPLSGRDLSSTLLSFILSQQGRDWLLEKQKYYTAWEAEYMDEGHFAHARRCGHTFVHTLHEYWDSIKHSAFTTMTTSATMHVLESKFKELHLEQLRNKQFPFITCAGHDFLKVCEAD